MLAARGLRCGEDFFPAFSPERENPGDAQHTTRTIPKVAGGIDWKLVLEVAPVVVDTRGIYRAGAATNLVRS